MLHSGLVFLFLFDVLLVPCRSSVLGTDVPKSAHFVVVQNRKSTGRVDYLSPLNASIHVIGLIVPSG